MASLWAVDAFGDVQIFRSLPNNWYAVTLPAIAVLVAGTFLYRLEVAIRLYLRFDHAWATALATQFIAALLVAVVLLHEYNSQFP